MFETGIFTSVKVTTHIEFHKSTSVTFVIRLCRSVNCESNNSKTFDKTPIFTYQTIYTSLQPYCLWYQKFKKFLKEWMNDLLLTCGVLKKIIQFFLLAWIGGKVTMFQFFPGFFTTTVKASRGAHRVRAYYTPLYRAAAAVKATTHSWLPSHQETLKGTPSTRLTTAVSLSEKIALCSFFLSHRDSFFNICNIGLKHLFCSKIEVNS